MKETWSLGETVVTGNVTRRKNAQSHVKLLHAESWQRWLSQCSLRLRFLFSLTLPCVIKNRMGHEMPKNQPDSLPKKKLFVGSVFSGQLGLSNPDPPQINVYLMILRAWIAMNQLSAALHAGSFSSGEIPSASLRSGLSAVVTETLAAPPLAAAMICTSGSCNLGR